jgi:hypothetical protein
MKVIQQILLVMLISTCACVNRNSQVTGSTTFNPLNKDNFSSTKDEDYYRSKGYQIFSKFGLAVKCPVTLQSVPDGNQNFTLHYGGIDDNERENKGGYYEVCIIDLSYYPSETIEQKFHHEILPRALAGCEKSIMTVAEKERTVYIKTYQNGGNDGKVLAFIQDGIVYMFNVIGNDKIIQRFESYTKSIAFYTENETQTDVTDVKEDITENISETSNMIFHQSKKYNYSVKYPKGWVMVEDYNQLLVFVAGDESSTKTFNITIINNVKRGLSELVEGNKAEMKMTFPDVKFLDEYNLRVNGMESIKVDTQCTNIPGTGQQYNSMYSFLCNNKLYIVNFGCETNEINTYKKTIRKIISTFKITNYK